MNFLSIFVLIPLLMLAGLWAAQGIKAIRGVMVTGASALLIASIVLTFMYLGERSAGNTAEMLFRADTLWYAPLHISYSVGVDGISVAMLLLSAVIVFTGTFASWRLQPLTKEYFLWFTLLSMGVFGFFISIDLFTMFMFYEIALIPMYLLIGVWGYDYEGSDRCVDNHIRKIRKHLGSAGKQIKTVIGNGYQIRGDDDEKEQKE